jgi:hypothetical protein
MFSRTSSRRQSDQRQENGRGKNLDTGLRNNDAKSTTSIPIIAISIVTFFARIDEPVSAIRRDLDQRATL